MNKINMRLEEFTRTVDDMCVCPNQRVAEGFFAEYGRKGTVTLDKVKCADEQIHLLWVCREKGKITGFIPLFVKDLQNIPKEYDYAIPVVHSQLFQEDGLFFLILQSQGKTEVRLMTMFPHQGFMEAFCHLKGIVPEEIYLVKMVKIADNKQVSVCWAVCHADEINPEQKHLMLQPVNLFDSTKLIEIGANHLNTEVIYENTSFVLDGKCYRLMKDEDGKRYLNKSEMQVVQCGVKKMPARKKDVKKAKATAPIHRVMYVEKRKEGD